MGVEVGSILSWMLCGLIVGLVVRFMGGQGMGLVIPVGLGIVGAVVSGYLLAWIWGAPKEPFSLSGGAWVGWVVAILGAALVLWVYVAINRSSARD